MKRLVRLYPRAWRDRYGAELEALLEVEPASAGSIADVIMGAVRAHGRAIRERLGGPQAGRAGGWVALMGGLLWAATFAVGWMVDWGRYGRDVGSLLLAGAAGLLVAAQLSMAVRTAGPWRPMAWAGALVALGGGLTLVGSVLTAIVLEPPLVIRLPVHPSTLWDQGMLLVMVGLAASSAARCASTSRRGDGIRDAVAGSTAIVLGVALFVPFEGDVLQTTVNEAGDVIAAFGYLAPVGWFVTNALVVAAGVAFGGAWASIGWGRLGDRSGRAGQRGQPEPVAAAVSQP